MITQKVFKKLLNEWSNQDSIINTSYEQHLYLTKSIIVCLSFFKSDQVKSALTEGIIL